MVSKRASVGSLHTRFMEQVRFIGALAKSPKTVGAIAPTARETADLMVSHIDLSSGLPVLELGPGTGAITSAILRRNLPQHMLFAVEYDARFCRELRHALPQAHIIQGNAFDLDAALPNGPDHFDCVISGLPLLNFEPAMRQVFLQGALKRLAPGRPLVQFSYGVNAPIVPDDKSVIVTRSRWIFRNIPPARVWTYSRSAP